MAAAAAPADDRLLRAFAGRIEPVPLTPGYAVTLAAVAVLMVALPLFYLGLIGLVGWLTWWHMVNDVTVFQGARGSGGAKWALVAYLGPLVIGAVLVLFMLKPLFARPPAGARPISLDPRREPRLFAFVAQLCDAVGAPQPSRIDVTCEVNASASFRRGWLSFFGQDLVLTIGLNLVAGQSLRQFAGVLAHEFGHFAQGWAMRASFVIRSVNFWFVRVVYQRDAWDQKLAEWSNSDLHLAVNLVLWLARGMVWLTRRILWLLMVVGHLCSSLLSRQMEFDADRHAARLVGREHFSSALRELPVLCAAERGAHADLGSAWRERRLADDLPALVGANLGQIPAELRGKLVADGLAESAGMYASHPATRDRIAAGQSEPERGVFGVDGPASQLFADFPALSRRATLAWYTEEAGLQVKADNLVPTVCIVADYERDTAAAKRAAAVLGPVWNGFTLFAPVGQAQEPADPDALAKALAACEEAVLDAEAASALCHAGLKPDAATFKLDSPTATAAQAKRTAALARRDELRQQAGRAAVALLPRLGGGDGAVRAALAVTAAAQPAADEVRAGMYVVSTLFANLKGREEDERFLASVRAEVSKLRSRLERLCKHGADHPYPFPHASAGITIERYLLPTLPPASDPGAVMDGCEQALGNLFALHRKCLGTMAADATA